MKIIKDKFFVLQLFKILNYIKKDKLLPVKKFEKELNNKLLLLKQNPYMYKKSIYFQNDCYRDLIYKGYTVIYKIENETILILEIFKWQET